MLTEYDYVAREFKRGYMMNRMSFSSTPSRMDEVAEDDSIQRATLAPEWSSKDAQENDISYSTGRLSLWEIPDYALTVFPKSRTSRYESHHPRPTRFLVTFDEPSTTVVERVGADDEVACGSLGEPPKSPRDVVVFTVIMTTFLMVVSIMSGGFFVWLGALPFIFAAGAFVAVKAMRDRALYQLDKKELAFFQLPVQDDYLCVEESSGRRIIRILKTVKNDSIFTNIMISKLKTVKTNNDLTYWLIAVERILDLDETFPMDAFSMVTSEVEEVGNALVAKDEARKARLKEIEDEQKREQEEIRQAGREYEERFAMEDSVLANQRAQEHIELL